MMNAERGMRLFASKGCVICHAVNGVGGHVAAELICVNDKPPR